MVHSMKCTGSTLPHAWLVLGMVWYQVWYGKAPATPLPCKKLQSTNKAKHGPHAVVSTAATNHGMVWHGRWCNEVHGQYTSACLVSLAATCFRCIVSHCTTRMADCAFVVLVIWYIDQQLSFALKVHNPMIVKQARVQRRWRCADRVLTVC